MTGFIKVLGGTAFLMTIVLLPVVLVSALLVFILPEGHSKETPQRNYIDLTLYEKSIDGTSSPAGAAFIDCEESSSLCQQIAASTCGEQKLPYLLATGYKAGYIREAISADCPLYKDLLDRVQSAS